MSPSSPLTEPQSTGVHARAYAQPVRLTGTFDGHLIVLTPAHAQQLANDHAAVRRTSAEEIRAMRPSAAVLDLLGQQHFGNVDLRAHPRMQAGQVILHPLNLMTEDPALRDWGQVIHSAFLGAARLLSQGDLDALQRAHASTLTFTESQGHIDLACGLPRSASIPDPTFTPTDAQEGTCHPGDYVQVLATGDIARVEACHPSTLTLRAALLLPDGESADDQPAVLCAETFELAPHEVLRFLGARQVTRAAQIRPARHMLN